MTKPTPFNKAIGLLLLAELGGAAVRFLIKMVLVDRAGKPPPDRLTLDWTMVSQDLVWLVEISLFMVAIYLLTARETYGCGPHDGQRLRKPLRILAWSYALGSLALGITAYIEVLEITQVNSFTNLNFILLRVAIRLFDVSLWALIFLWLRRIANAEGHSRLAAWTLVYIILSSSIYVGKTVTTPVLAHLLKEGTIGILTYSTVRGVFAIVMAMLWLWFILLLTLHWRHTRNLLPGGKPDPQVFA